MTEIEKKEFFIHSLADVQTKDIGAETKIWQFSIVLKNAKILHVEIQTLANLNVI